LLVIALVLILVGAAASYYFYTKNRESQALIKDPTSAQAAQVKTVIAEVGKLMYLPQGEDPTVANVLDVTKLSDQPFFAKAKDGDEVLIYSKAGTAILYRPSTNLIVNVSPINLGGTAGTSGTASNHN